MQDWRNSGDYEYTEGLTLSEWAWEFLRRSDSYRKSYEEHAEAWRTLIGALHEKSKPAVSYRALEADRRFGLPKMYPPDTQADEISDLEWIVSPSISLRWQPQSRLVEPWPGYPDAVALVFDLTLPLDQQQKVTAEILDRLRQIRSEDGSYSRAQTAEEQLSVRFVVLKNWRIADGAALQLKDS